MTEAIFTAQFVKLTKLNHIFVELTAANCNLRCKHCYLNFEPYKKIKDFLPIDKVKKMLYDTRKEQLEYIYLTGGEPMLHPHFNNILRMCLKRTNVTVCTNAMTINDKKARFLHKVENETQNELIIKTSLNHYEEIENDNIRGRGNYRKVIFALQSLIKYEFNPLISIVNHSNEPEKELIGKYQNAFQKFGIELDDINISIIPYFDKTFKPEQIDFIDLNEKQLDCCNSRILTNKGIYTCPLMTSDQRGRMGIDFNDYSKKNYIETDTCMQCAKNGKNLFINSFQ